MHSEPLLRDEIDGRPAWLLRLRSTDVLLCQNSTSKANFQERCFAAIFSSRMRLISATVSG